MSRTLKTVLCCVALTAYLLTVFFYISSADVDHDYLDFVSIFTLVGILLWAARRTWLYVGITAILSLGIGLEVAFVYRYGSRVGMGVLYSVLDSNMFESSRMLGTMGWTTVACSLATAAVLLVLYCAGGLTLRSRWPICILILLGVSKLGLLVYKIDTNQIGWGYNLRADPIRTLADLAYDKQPVFLGDALFLYEGYRESAENRHRVAHTQMPDGLSRDLASVGPKQIVVIVGEASFAGHYSAYGYARDTTPAMQRIFSGPHACAVAHVHSPAPLTRDALVQDLTFSTPHDLAPLHDEKNVIEMARAAGYKTYWISSTSERGFYSSEIGQISGYSDDFSDQFTNNPRPGGGTGDDLDLIARFKAVLNPAERQIIFLHLNGSHLPYGVRYDIDDARALPGPPSDQLDYDRSLHHTDRLVSGVYDLLHAASSDYLLFYAPDHGEVIDPAAVAKAGATGHGLEFGGVDQYEIPLMMTSTRDGYCSDVERYRGADGTINAFAEHDLFSQFVGYRIGPAAWRAYEAEQPYVLHSDEHVYRYPDLPTR